MQGGERLQHRELRRRNLLQRCVYWRLPELHVRHLHEHCGRQFSPNNVSRHVSRRRRRKLRQHRQVQRKQWVSAVRRWRSLRRRHLRGANRRNRWGSRCVRVAVIHPSKDMQRLGSVRDSRSRLLRRLPMRRLDRHDDVGHVQINLRNHGGGLQCAEPTCWWRKYLRRRRMSEENERTRVHRGLGVRDWKLR